jgi:hypothetical protein
VITKLCNVAISKSAGLHVVNEERLGVWWGGFLTFRRPDRRWRH